MNRSANIGQPTHLGERIIGGLALVVVALILALAGCDAANETKPVDKPTVDVGAPGVDVEINKPDDVDSEQ